jgi:flavin-binding protein dodecin
VTVIKVIELIGTSPKSWSDAAQNAVTEAAARAAVHVKRST